MFNIKNLDTFLKTYKRCLSDNMFRCPDQYNESVDAIFNKFKDKVMSNKKISINSVTFRHACQKVGIKVSYTEFYKYIYQAVKFSVFCRKCNMETNENRIIDFTVDSSGLWFKCQCESDGFTKNFIAYNAKKEKKNDNTLHN